MASASAESDIQAPALRANGAYTRFDETRIRLLPLGICALNHLNNYDIYIKQGKMQALFNTNLCETAGVNTGP